MLIIEWNGQGDFNFNMRILEKQKYTLAYRPRFAIVVFLFSLANTTFILCACLVFDVYALCLMQMFRLNAYKQSWCTSGSASAQTGQHHSL